MQHGHDYRSENVAGWIATEKLDGIRLFWDGQRAWSKEGNEIALTPAFRASLPRGLAVEGELHCGRGGYKQALSLFKSGPVDDRLTFTICDAPRSHGGWMDRIATIPACGHEVVEHTIVKDFEEALELYIEITDDGGEGVMLRDPALIYTPGRTRGLLKLKTVPAEWADTFADMCCA
jgi:DNA ligase 1